MVLDDTRPLRLESESVAPQSKDLISGPSYAEVRMLYELSSDGILGAESETKMFRYANPAAVRMLRYTEHELRTMSLAEIHAKESPDVLPDFEACSGKTQAEDIPLRRKDGTVVYTHASATSITVDGRAITIYVLRDVTDRRQARLAIEASERRYRRLFETAKDGILILDGDSGQIVDVNPFLAALMGYSRGTFLGTIFGRLALSRISLRPRTRSPSSRPRNTSATTTSPSRRGTAERSMSSSSATSTA